MTQLLRLASYERVLEVGTGSGYHTAILSRLVAYVYSLERSPRLAERAGHVLDKLGYDNVDIHVGDGSQGLRDMAPFDVIVVSAAAPELPGPMCGQMNPLGGRMMIPVGSRDRQQLQLVLRSGDHWRIENILPVHFVSLIGRYGFRPRF